MSCVRILIAEDIPANNKGEAALFYGLIESLECVEEKEISLLSTDPDDDEKYYGNLSKVVDARGVIPAHCVTAQASLLKRAINYAVYILKHAIFVISYKLFGRAAFSIFNRAIWKNYIDTDVVIIGHDSAWSPLYHSTMVAFMSLLRKPCFVYAGSLTPSNPLRTGYYKNIAEAFTRWTLKRVRLITLRETISERMINAIGIDSSNAIIETYPDLAFLLPPASEERITELLKDANISPDDDYIGMAFNRRTLRHAYPLLGNDDARFNKAVEELSLLADAVVEKYSVKIVFIPHSIGPTPNLDDRIIARRIIEGMNNPDKAISLENNYWAHELKGIASKLKLTISSRLHFCIDTLSSEVPALFLTYKKDIRGHGIIGEMMGRSDYIRNIDEMDSVNKSLLEAIDSLWKQRSEITDDLKAQLPDIRRDTKKHGERLYDEFLKKDA